MKTTVYLIRHSVRINTKDVIESWKTSQDKVLRSEKIILSVTGEKRAEILSNEEELQNIDVVYTSNCVRTLQTAKYLLEKQHLKANIDERFDERRVGIPNDGEVTDWYVRQYEDENYKTIGGESQADVRNRMYEALQEVVEANQGKRIAIFSHGYAITFLLLKWCKLNNVNNKHNLEISFNGKTIFNKKLNSPEVFKLVLDENNKVENIENIEFADLEYDDFDKKELQ